MPWGQVAAKVWGEPGGVPLIALHDWRDNAASFDLLAPLLSAPLVALDLPGHGRSVALPPASQTFSPSNIFTLRFLLRKLGHERVSIVGHGVGGQLGLLYAGLYPERVERLVLMDPRQEAPSAALADRIGGLLDDVLTAHAQKSKPVGLKQLLAAYRQRGLSEEAARLLLQRSARKVGADGYIDATDEWIEKAQFRQLFDRTEAALAAKVTCPVLSVEADPAKATAQATRAIFAKSAASFVHCKVAAGQHHAHLEQPEKVAEVLNQFLQL
jgi:pimeloyl-ACP methyl ester carboxylesterase